MLEDKLTHEQRIRLEALNQAIALSAMKNTGPRIVIDYAIMFEQYIRGER